MKGPARSGVLIYAKNIEKVSQFYSQVLPLKCVHADAEHQILHSGDVQLIIQAIPAHIADSIEIAAPPEPREEQAIKPFFTIENLAEAERIVFDNGGSVCGPVWPGPGFNARNVCDPEGNIIHLREFSK